MAAGWFTPDGYNNYTQHPHRIFQSDTFDETGLGLLVAGVDADPLWIEIVNTDTVGTTFIFSSEDALTEFVRVRLRPNESFVLPGWHLQKLGLSVATAATPTTNFPLVTVALPDASA